MGDPTGDEAPGWAVLLPLTCDPIPSQAVIGSTCWAVPVQHSSVAHNCPRRRHRRRPRRRRRRRRRPPPPPPTLFGRRFGWIPSDSGHEANASSWLPTSYLPSSDLPRVTSSPLHLDSTPTSHPSPFFQPRTNPLTRSRPLLASRAYPFSQTQHVPRRPRAAAPTA